MTKVKTNQAEFDKAIKGVDTSILNGVDHHRFNYVITLGLTKHSKGVMFVLYAVTNPHTMNAEKTNIFVYKDLYLGQLSSDFGKAVEAARAKIPKYKILVWDDTTFINRKFNVLNFGKYNGKTVEEIFDIDQKYIFWAAKNVSPKTKKMSELFAQYRIIERDLAIKENRTKSNGALPLDLVKTTRKLKVYSFSHGFYPNQFQTRLRDENGNKFSYTGKWLDDVGEEVVFTGFVKGSFEAMGVMFNTLAIRKPKLVTVS